MHASSVALKHAKPSIDQTQLEWIGYHLTTLHLLIQMHRQSVYSEMFYWLFLKPIDLRQFMLTWGGTWHAELQHTADDGKIWIGCGLLSRFCLFFFLKPSKWRILFPDSAVGVFLLLQLLALAFFLKLLSFWSSLVSCSICSHRDCAQPGAVWPSPPERQCAVQHQGSWSNYSLSLIGFCCRCQRSDCHLFKVFYPSAWFFFYLLKCLKWDDSFQTVAAVNKDLWTWVEILRWWSEFHYSGSFCMLTLTGLRI